MFARASALALCLTMMFVGGAQASDWVDNSETKHVGQGGFLSGSASTFARVPVPAYQQGEARYSETAANLGSDAQRFLDATVRDQTVRPDDMRAWLDRTHPELRARLQNNPDEVLDVKGAWDDSSKIITAMGIREHRIKAHDLIHMDLNQTRVIIINCDGKIPRDAWEPIRQWVIRGGYLISTDWTLGDFIQQAFPGMIAWNRENTSGETVDALLVGQDQKMYAGTNVLRATWKLDEKSQEVRVLRPDVVQVLARSYKLGLQDPNRGVISDPNCWGVLACEFPYGRGRVLHLVGHFDYNSPMGFRQYVLPDPIPGAGIGLRQAIATNFLVQGLEHR